MRYVKILLTGSILGLTLLLAGCASMGLHQSLTPTTISTITTVDVKMEVFLERAFVQSHSNLGAGAVAMWALVGPFSNDVINLYGTIKEKEGSGKTAGSFSTGLKWGENSFNIRAPYNSEIRLQLRSGGTRSGMTDIGFVKIGNADHQVVIIKLTEAGVEIE